MRINRYAVIAGSCVAGLALMAWAQSPKAGLYEVTSHMTWQQSPFPEGMKAPPGAGGPHSSQVCVTQSQIDKYNGPKPQAHGSCDIKNIRKSANGMTAEIVCSGQMAGQGTVNTTWTDSGHSKSKVHFTGAMQMGPNSKTIEWTVESESTFKGSDCGSVKPTIE